MFDTRYLHIFEIIQMFCNKNVHFDKQLNIKGLLLEKLFFKIPVLINFKKVFNPAKMN